MFSNGPPERWIGILAILASLIALLIWIPFDTETGYVDIVRRRAVIGDALAPSFAAALLGLAGLALALRPGLPEATLGRHSFIWLCLLLAVLTISLLAMRYAGPFASALFGTPEYRTLRDTLPWKYIGFLLGGTFLAGGLTCLVERQLSFKRFAVAFLAVLVIALVIDLPFDDLLLPPSGDV